MEAKFAVLIKIHVHVQDVIRSYKYPQVLSSHVRLSGMKKYGQWPFMLTPNLLDIRSDANRSGLKSGQLTSS